MGILTRGGFRRRLILLAAALALAIASVIILPIGSSQAVETVEQDAGVLLLRVDSNSGAGWVEYYPDANPGEGLGAPSLERQEFEIGRKCDFGHTSGPPFLSITQTGGSRGVGAVSNGLGVKTKNNCSTSQGQIVSPSESLTFTLGTNFGDSIRITRGEVDVEGKGGTDLGVTYTLGSASTSETIELSNSADNGPDSGTGDNEIAVLDPTDSFRSVTFEATDGKVAIEGGGDGAVPGGSLRSSLGITEGTVFQLASIREYDAGELDCGDTGVGPSTTADPTGPAEEIELGRGENLKAVGCEEVEYTFRIEADSVLFDANLDDQPGTHFVIKIDWDPMDDPVDPFDPPNRRVNFFPDTAPTAYEQVHACTGLIDEGSIDDPNPDIDDVYGHPLGRPGSEFEGETVPWCLAGEQLVLLADEWQQIQWYDGTGDPRFR